MLKEISWQDFEIIELTTGTIIKVEDNLKSNKPSYKIWADFGEKFGIKKTSSQIIQIYKKEELIGKQIIGVLNFPKKLIGGFSSEFLLTGFNGKDGVVIAIPERKIDNGLKLL